MTSLAAALLVVVVSLTVRAEDPKPPVTVLEGAWREATLPGEKVATTFSITFTGDKVTINIEGQVLQGTFQTNRGAFPTVITITITAAPENWSGPTGDYQGKYWFESDRLFLCVAPRYTSRSTNYLGLAAVPRTLQKVKK